MRDIEKAIYHKNMSEMRDLVQGEVWHMAEMVGINSIDLDPPKTQPSMLDDLDELDLDELRFKVSVIDGPVIPLQYLQSTDDADNDDDGTQEGKIWKAISKISFK
jgi:hypothetical protein